MGDVPPPSSSEEFSAEGPQQPVNTHPRQQQHYGQEQPAFSSQFNMAQPSGNARPGPYNMANMANALPQQQGNFRPVGYPPTPQQQHFSPSTSSAAMMSPMNTPYAQHNAMGLPAQHYYMPQQHPTQQYYGAPLSPMQQQARPNANFYPNHMAVNHQQQAQMSPGFYYPQLNNNFQHHHPAMFHGQYYQGSGMMADPRSSSQSPPGDHAPNLQYTQGPKSAESMDAKSGVVRGPPRKPRQSGHAIWIGNLPPQTDLMSLVHHVCKEAAGLESLFLISKSNCAFANFKNEQSCIGAQQKLHDSKFQTVRLVSRLRKNTVEGTAGLTAPTGPAAATETPIAREPVSTTIVDGNTEKASEQQINEVQQPLDGESPAQKDKFYILKSLTEEDLELSVRTGIWATQSHNEETLNKAFKAVENVYLVFSANKSGEYFGYARMLSAINDDPAAAIEFAPKAQSFSDVDLPKAIPTEATEYAPKGRIIDDSARGTIFWETDKEESGSGDEEEESEGGEDMDGSAKSWGKPFRLEWLSTTRLPFYRARGLRNPWNSNREVKIARDGTELEPSVGRKLIGLFNRVQSPGPMVDSMHQGMQGMHQGMAMMAGFAPPTRPRYQ